MGWMGWLTAAAILPVLVAAATLAVWTVRLGLAMRRRGDVPPYGHPDPLPLPEYVRRDLAGFHRRNPSPGDDRRP